MQKKIIGVFFSMLLTVAAVLPAAGIINISNTKPVDSYISSDTVLEQEIEDSSEIDEPDETVPMPHCTKTGYLSITAAAFTPRTNNSYVENDGYLLYGEDNFVAPVYLPHKATITNLTYYWINEAPASSLIYLYRNQMNGDVDEMAYAWCCGEGTGSDWTDEIYYAEIDNSMYSYYVEISIIPGMGCYGVVIEYTYPKGSSSVSMYEEESQVPNSIVR